MVCAETIRKANYDIDRLVEMYPELKDNRDHIELTKTRLESQKWTDKRVIDFVNTIDKVIIRKHIMK
jgi:hypothetical protein